MNKKIFNGLALLLIVFAIDGCGPSDRKVEKAQEEVLEAREELNQAEASLENAKIEYETAQKEWKQKLILNAEKITVLGEKIIDVKNEANTKSVETLKLLEKKNNELKTRLAKFALVSFDKWKTFEAEFNRDMKELTKQLIEFQSK